MFILYLDPDAANGNPTEVTKAEPVKDDVSKNEKSIKNTKNANKKSKMANNEPQVQVNKEESSENGKDETDKVSKEVEKPITKDEEAPAPTEKPAAKPATPSGPAVPPVVVTPSPKYKYSDGNIDVA